jgi:DNA-binding PadR family transcriptional regulator
MNKGADAVRDDGEGADPVTAVPAPGRQRRSPGASSINIVLLGLVKQQPRGAYEVSRLIKQRRLRSWIKISDASVYRNLRILADQGYLSTRVTREGAMPEKTIFELTETGNTHLGRLIRDAAAAPLMLHFDFDVWLGHLGFLSPAEAAECRDMLNGQLDTLSQELGEQIEQYGGALPPGVYALLELRREILAVTRRWLDDFPVPSETETSL